MTTFDCSTYPQQMNDYPTIPAEITTYLIANQDSPIEQGNAIRLKDIAEEHVRNVEYIRDSNLHIIDFTNESIAPIIGRVCVNPQNLSSEDKLEFIRIQMKHLLNQQERMTQKIDGMIQRTDMPYQAVSHQAHPSHPTNIEAASSPVSIVPENKGTFSIVGDILAWPFLKIYELFKCLFCGCNSES